MHETQLVEARGIAVVMGEKAGDRTFREWEIHAFMRQKFREDMSGIRELFPEVLDELVPFDLGKVIQ